MYERFFNLKEKPFNLTPSSRFLYLGEAHKEALALLRYGVLERKGFILLTGEVGTGKTTMAQAFLSEMDKRVHCVYLSNPLLTAEDLYNYLAFSAFKKRVIYKSKAAFILDFEAFLRDRLKNQEAFVLIIDEAQKLSFELLEEIRLLSNMETAEEKLINIFLIGQPELNEKLSDPRCRPLLQRISIRHHIKPLNLRETTEYLSTRLRVAGVDEMGKIFPPKAAEAIYEYSHGYPRVINVLADNVLLLCFSKNERKVRPEFVKQCFDDMKLEGSFLAKPETREVREQTQKVVEIDKPRSRRLRLVILFLVLGFLGFAGGFASSERVRAVISGYGAYLPKNVLSWFTPQEKEKTAEVSRAEPATPNLSPATPPEVKAEHGEDVTPKTTAEKLYEEKTPEEKTVVASVDTTAKPQSQRETVLELPAKIALAVAPGGADPGEKERSLDFITVKSGDTVIGLALKYYGRADGKILDLLQEKNPELKNIDRIEIGQRIHFPSLPAVKEEGKTFTVHVASFKPFENAQALFQRFMQEGYEVYLMPGYNPEKGRIHRITLGSFKTRREGDAFAADLLKKGKVEYAETILLEAR